MRIILIDAGNTRLKWASIEAGAWSAIHAAHYDDLGRFAAALEGCAAAWLASVTRDAWRERVLAVLQAAAVPLRSVAVQAEACGVRNGYRAPQQLGVDRWMALIGARARTLEACLVVSAGTALTIDALDADGYFLGGIIVPGVHAQQACLAASVAGVDPEDGQRPRSASLLSQADLSRPFPASTAEAVRAGALAAVCGAIRVQRERLAAHAGRPPVCLLTGGDADLIASQLDFETSLAPGLVLEGIACVAHTPDAGCTQSA